jgi:hypothetical protein
MRAQGAATDDEHACFADAGLSRDPDTEHAFLTTVAAHGSRAIIRTGSDGNYFGLAK